MRPVWSVAAFFGLLACPATQEPGTTPPPDPPPTGVPPSFHDLGCDADPVVPTVLHCTWSVRADDAGSGLVETWPEADPGSVSATPAGPEGAAHDRRVMELVAGNTYGVRAVVVRPDGTRVEAEPTTAAIPSPSWAPGRMVEGSPTHPYLLTALSTDGDSRPAILNADGDLVWYHEPPAEALITTARLSRDGASVLYQIFDQTPDGSPGILVRVALDGSSVVETGILGGHHDFVEHADGTIAWLGYDYATYGSTLWQSDAIRRIAEGTDDPAPPEYFTFFDHYGIDPYVFAPGPQQPSWGPADLEWSHSNSLMTLDDGATYLVMSKFLDNLIKVDAAGTVLWQMGGPYSTFTHPGGGSVWRDLDDTDLWSHAHMSEIWSDGLLVFDNGVYNTGTSRVVEYGYDEALQTVWEVWSVTEPDNRFTNVMGDARRLANGNTLIGWGTLNAASEVDPGGVEVWRVELQATAFSRVTPMDGLYPP